MDDSVLDVTPLDPIAELAIGRRTPESIPPFFQIDVGGLHNDTVVADERRSEPVSWQALHLIAWSIDDLDGLPTWFAAWDSISVPCGQCRQHWEDYKAAYPPDFDSRAGFFWWTWRAHNAVAYRIGKAVWSLREAYRHYNSNSSRV